ncbi:MAG: DUF882 domain-containing protein [Deltaproteobacteria bacterium]|nr:DUF882 domain-containing protein [Deltaproteobacteria bacterium]
MTLRLFCLCFFLSLTPKGWALEADRFFYSGDGKLQVEGGQKKLDHFSGRLIALLDYLEEHWGSRNEKIKILSGYRSPEYNDGLRRQGRLAGKASLHMEGMAADFVMKGVPAKTIWDYVRTLNCCGVGFYHGDAVHIDTGPPRFWDEKSSKVGTDISLHNKTIWLTTLFDIYQPGEAVVFNIVRITEYPFGIKKNLEIQRDGKTIATVSLPNTPDCLMIQKREEGQNFSLSLLEGKIPYGEKLKIKASFCNKPSPEMPDATLSNPFTIASPG